MSVQESGTNLVFDPASGGRAERLVFNHRLVVLLLCAIMTVLMAYVVSTRLSLSASYEKMLPQSHPYVLNYLHNSEELSGLGGALRVVVANPHGEIFDPQYLELLRQITDELFMVPGVDRAWVKSLWTPAVRWTEVTEEGFRGGPVMPGAYDGSQAELQKLQRNLGRAGILGDLVANDYRSSMIFVPLLDKDPTTGQALDYAVLSKRIAEIRDKYEAQGKVSLHIVGFAQIIGELVAGLSQVMLFFAVATLIVSLIIYFYTRCLISTLLVVACSLVAVLWQLGLVALMGFKLDPFSILVPFLVFAIGVSHGAQKMNGIMQDIACGVHRLVAARLTFRRLFLAGLTALLADVVGFAVLMLFDIPVIRDLALAASIGVGVLVFTNLILLPVLLSYTGVSASAAQRSLQEQESEPAPWSLVGVLVRLQAFTRRRWAVSALLAGLLLGGLGFMTSFHLKIGDLDAGAPELRSDSRYNLDNAYVVNHYTLSSDQFAVIVKTPPDSCMRYEVLDAVDRLAWELEQLPGVQTTQSLVGAVRQITSGSYEGNPKWLTLSRNQDVINYGAQAASVNNQDLFNVECSVMPVIAYLTDHRADTLDQVAAVVEDFAARHNNEQYQFLLAAGNAGIEAATNQVVRKAWIEMQVYVYLAVAVLCFITFRSWRAVVVAVLPLALTSFLCEALMVYLGIGVKVATLPVIALGVGIGVDYALYLLSIQLAEQRAGATLAQAYRRALSFTGKVVAVVGVTLSVSVITWAWSPIKFQADMGILLAFMFLWNMVGALVLIPALSHFLIPGTVRSAPMSHDSQAFNYTTDSNN
ncbi:MMPL family transporter [Pseudomonas sp. P8_241]|nr:MMPL family transporter [Pseudomonas sp. P8_241]WPN49940.1 MMPL family transporter [Pseudomonas sp. P8_241]